jgi:hypothetical protein
VNDKLVLLHATTTLPPYCFLTFMHVREILFRCATVLVFLGTRRSFSLPRQMLKLDLWLSVAYIRISATAKDRPGEAAFWGEHRG